MDKKATQVDPSLWATSPGELERAYVELSMTHADCSPLPPQLHSPGSDPLLYMTPEAYMDGIVGMAKAWQEVIRTLKAASAPNRWEATQGTTGETAALLCAYMALVVLLVWQPRQQRKGQHRDE